MNEPLRKGQLVTIIACPTANQHAGWVGTVETEASTDTRLGVKLASGWWCWPLKAVAAESSDDNDALGVLMGERQAAQDAPGVHTHASE